MAASKSRPSFGYDVQAVDGVNDGLLCSECNLILREAVQTPDGVRLCQQCYNGIKQSPGFVSSTTGISILDEDGNPACYPDRAVRREVKKLQVVCSNKQFGCDYIGKLEKYFEEHVNNCVYKPISCPNEEKGCADLIPASDVGRHLLECQFRDVTCQYCNERITWHKLKVHYDKCLQYPVECDFCQQIIERDQVSIHKGLDCPKLREREGVPNRLSSADTILTHILWNMKHKSTTDTFSVKDRQYLGQPQGNSFVKQVESLRARISDLELQLQASTYRERISDLELQASAYREHFFELQQQVLASRVCISELELQLQASLASTHNGAFLWRIPEIARRKSDAIEERVTSIYSPPFYTGRNGYKMCVRAYLNGDGMGYKTHLSLFFVLMKGEFDALLKWPFEYKVSLILVDQNHQKHIVQTFEPIVESSHWPVTDMNVASGCPQFAKLTVLEDENYVKDDTVFIKCIVDTSKIFHP